MTTSSATTTTSTRAADESAQTLDLILELGENHIDNARLLASDDDDNDNDDDDLVSLSEEASFPLLNPSKRRRRRDGGSYVKKERRRANASIPILRTAKRLAVGLPAGVLGIALGGIAGCVILPILIVRHRRNVLTLLDDLPLRSPVLKRPVLCVAHVILVVLGSFLGAVAGALLGLTFPLLVALYGPNAPDELLRFRRPVFSEDGAKVNAGLSSTGVSCFSEVLHRRRWDASASTHDAYDIFLRLLLPKSEPRALLVFHHGLHCHGASKHNMDLALYFAERGYVVVLPDGTGHGQSDGALAIITDFNDMAADLSFVCERMCAKFDGLPLFVMGESMGGLLALLAGSGGDLDRLAGVLATCPAFLIPRQDGGVVDALVDYLPLDLLAQVFPKLPVDKGVKGICYPEDPVLRERAIKTQREDGLVYRGWMKLATAATFKRTLLSFSGREKILQRLRASAVPLLLQHGTADRCVDIRGTRHIKRSLGADTCTDIEYSGKCHCLMAEDEETGQAYLGNSLKFCERILSSL